ncbi:glycosyltransferase family protein, partial [Flavobacterium bizetiae]
FRVKRNDVVLVYHSYLLNKVVNFCRFFANFKLIYEVEEIYQAAWQNSNKKIKHEIEALQNADAFIFVNDVMNQKCNHHNKPFIVCYGNYNNKKIAKSINYNIINIVYAGFIGGKDSDVMLAIDSAEFLPDNYFLNVLGYGTEENIKGMKNKIKEINVKCGKEIVEYFGCLSGDEYDNFLKKCQIGLSTRVLIDEYSDFTFPSKVLVYLSNNIIPVSSKINCILNSKVSESIVFYDENSPASVAEAIVSIDVNKYYSQDKDVITDLDSKFILDFNKLLN